jgi:hypothetical protein
MPQIEIIFLTDDAYEISQGITIWQRTEQKRTLSSVACSV